MISVHREELTKMEQESIEKFIKANEKKSDYQNPLITSKKETHLLNDIINKKRIKSGHRIPALIGKFGVFASMKIPKNTVIGRYIGFECTNKEWNEVYDYTNADAKHGEYLFSFNIDEKVEDNHDGSRQITIDPLHGNMNDLSLLYINDIRANIFESEPTEQDKALQNCKFIVVKEYGWPVVFVITTKSIQKGKELLMDYGVGFSSLLQQNARWQRIMKMTSDQIVNNVIRSVELNDTHDLY